MSAPLSDLSQLLQQMQPVRQAGVWAFASLPVGTDLSSLDALASFREAEGLSVVINADAADRAGLPVLFRAAWISLTVHSDLAAVGLTAAVATALAQAGIACNVVAAARHDHLFVPLDKADPAMVVLRRLQDRGPAPTDS